MAKVKMRSAKCFKVLSIFSALIAIGLILKAAYIPLKAELAQHLMQQAWQESLQRKVARSPWSWADGKVIGKIKFGQSSHYILSEASGRNLAFAPSLMSASSQLNAIGNSVIVGHRDTHFTGLQTVAVGDIIELEYIGGARQYRVEEIAVISEHDIEVLEQTNNAVLTLITCYPFNTLNANPALRYVIRADALGS